MGKLNSDNAGHSAIPISHRAILAALACGALGGSLAHVLWEDAPTLVWLVDGVVEPIGRLFLRLIFMIVLPLVFSALALGVCSFGDLGRLGRVGLETLLATVVISSVSAAIGIFLVNVLQPGTALSDEARQSLLASLGRAAPVSTPQQTPLGLQVLLQMVPENPLRAAAQGEMLPVMVFALVCGLGLARAPRTTAGALIACLEGVFEMSMQVVGLAMRLAPLGVACLVFTLAARAGVDVLRPLVAYVGVVLLGLGLHLTVTYSLLLRLFTRWSPAAFFAAVKPAMVTAFATSSSNATLPTTLQVARERLGVPRDVANFVLTLGSTANQNGTALFEGVTVLFLAQFFGVPLSAAQQLLVVGMSVLAGVGTAGVPGGSLPLIVPVLVTVGVPAEGIGIILGVDRFLDMCRTVLNVVGDLVVAVLVAASKERRITTAGDGPSDGRASTRARAD